MTGWFLLVMAIDLWIFWRVITILSLAIYICISKCISKCIYIYNIFCRYMAYELNGGPPFFPGESSLLTTINHHSPLFSSYVSPYFHHLFPGVSSPSPRASPSFSRHLPQLKVCRRAGAAELVGSRQDPDRVRGRKMILVHFGI